MYGLGCTVAIVAGGARGLGRGIAKRLDADGAAVIVPDIKVCEGSAAATATITDNDGKAVAVEVDISNAEQLAHLLDETERVFGRIGSPQAVLDEAAAKSRHRRVGEPQDIARVAFLISGEARWVSGQHIRVNGTANI